MSLSEEDAQAVLDQMKAEDEAESQKAEEHKSSIVAIDLDASADVPQPLEATVESLAGVNGALQGGAAHPPKQKSAELKLFVEVRPRKQARPTVHTRASAHSRHMRNRKIIR